MEKLASALIAIYDASIDDLYWEQALNVCVEATGARSASLMVMDTATEPLISVSKVSRVLSDIDPDIVNFYNKTYIHFEKEGWEIVARNRVRTLITDKQVWPLDDSILRTRDDYVYLLKHANVFRRVAARLNDNLAWSDNVAFQFHRNHKIIPPTSMHAISQLLPHMAKAIDLGRSFGMLQAQYSAVLTALDFVEIGMCVALPTGQIVVKNLELERIFSSNNGVMLSPDGRLKTEDQLMNRAIQLAIERTSAASAGSNTDSEVLFSAPTRNGNEPFLIEISPLRDSRQELASAMNGSLIIIIDPANTRPFRIERLASAYNLTNAETDISQMLLKGWSTSDIAETRNVSRETIKTQISRIMKKTESKQRSDLIRLALKTSPPIKMPESPDGQSEKK